MHLLNAQSLASGQVIQKPELYSTYYPVPNKYIVLQPISRPAKSYDLWVDVLDILFPILNKAGISILQIGANKEPAIKYCINTVGQTSLLQTNFIIQHAELLLGVDSFGAHIACMYDKKMVILYSTNYLKNTKPYWGSAENQILFEPIRQGKPSFSNEEQPKLINTIKPEDIALAVCKLLGLEVTFPYTTLKIGELYTRGLIESIPTQVVQISSLGVDSVVMRMDLVFNEQKLVEQLNHGNCSILTDKPINPQLLKAFKPRIKEVIYLIDENHNPFFVKELYKQGIRFLLITYLSEEKLNPIKLDYMDFGVIHQKKSGFPPELKDLDLNKVYYKTNKYLLSDGLVYPSSAAWRAKQPVENFNGPIQKVINTDEFFREQEHLAFLVEKS